METEKVTTSVWDLLPDHDYEITLGQNGGLGSLQVRTLPESVTLSVREFGAVGDGVHDDTAAIQAAILACPPQGRVLMEKGTYCTGPLFLKSTMYFELAAEATLQLLTDRAAFPILPGMVQTTDEKDDVNYGTWEGNPLNCFASLLTGLHVSDILVYGRGILDGRADEGDWWDRPKIKRGAYRPRMIFLNHCSHVIFQGFSVCRSPSWNLHPYFSDHLGFYDLSVSAPARSPNTDGFDPESCQDVHMSGVHFSVGDDCIAIKSGKIYMGQRYKTPCSNLEIDHCLMENGHGGVTIGSEMAGGVQHVHIHHCDMRHTDRGLRVKTRRGRGVQGRLDDIRMDHVRMDHVCVPLAINCMYFCDPDGHSEYVQTRSTLPVDERTPSIGTVTMDHIQATHATNAGYVLGLPEQEVEKVIMRQVDISLDPDATPISCIMAEGIEPCAGQGLVLENVADFEPGLVLTGQKGPAVIQKKTGAAG